MKHDLEKPGEESVVNHERDIVSVVGRQVLGEKSAGCQKKMGMLRAMISPGSMQPVGDA